MKNTYIAIGVIIILVFGFLVLRKDKKNDVAEVPGIPTSEEAAENPTDGTPQMPSQTPETPQTYSYTNSEFGFAVDLPGLIVTEKNSVDPILKPYIFTFGVGDQSSVPEEERIPNSMAVYVWKNPAEFKILMSQKATIATETVNGHEFSVYIIDEGPRTSYRYATNQGGVTYDVGVWNRSDINKFFLLD